MVLVCRYLVDILTNDKDIIMIGDVSSVSCCYCHTMS